MDVRRLLIFPWSNKSTRWSSRSVENNDAPPCSSAGSATPAITPPCTRCGSGLRESVGSNHLNFVIPFPATLDFPGITKPRTPTDESAVESSCGQEGILEAVSTHQEADIIIEVFQLPEPEEPRDLINPVRPLPICWPSENDGIPFQKDLPSPEKSPVVAQVTTQITESEPRRRQISLDAPRTFYIENLVTANAAIQTNQTTIILPFPPNQDDKTMYAQTRRLPLYLFGTISFLSVSTGMWFYSLSSRISYWFGFFVGLIQIYLIISYVVGYLGKDFNLEEHRKVIENYGYPSDKIPSIDIYLPCCHEPLEVLENTYQYVAKLKYPKFKVYVLDDGGLEIVERLSRSYGFEYMSRDNKPYLKKAGNLRHAFARTEGEFFVVFDADFCPCEDFLEELLPYMNKYPDVAIVQSPQFFRPSSKQTWVEQGASATQELFYRVVQVNRDRWGASICVGSNALYRRAALVDVGGTAEIGHSEDLHTGFYALARGWKLKYIPLALACGISPSTPRAFFSQQMRWCSGSTTLLTNSDFWKSKLTIVQKLCYLSGMMYYTAAALTIFLASAPGIMMVWIHPDLVMWYNLAYAFPSLIYSVFVFRLWSRQMYNFNVNFVFVIQQYAYLMAIKDRIFGTTASWVPSGDNKSHATSGQKKTGGNNKYRNMRILCALWMYGSVSALIVGVTLRILEGHRWWNFLPLLLLDSFNLFTTHRFIFYSK